MPATMEHLPQDQNVTESKQVVGGMIREAIDEVINEVIDAESFDMFSFFDNNQDDELNDNSAEIKEEINGIEATTGESARSQSDLLISLRDESEKVVANYTTKVTAESFNTSSSFVFGAASLFSSLIGTCGPVCFHSLGAVAKAGSSVGSAANFSGASGLSMPNFSVDANGNFKLDGDINSLSQLTGYSKRDLLSGKIPSENIIAALFDSFGEGISMAFGFGFIHSFIDLVFDSFGQNSQAA